MILSSSLSEPLLQYQFSQSFMTNYKYAYEITQMLESSVREECIKNCNLFWSVQRNPYETVLYNNR